MGIAKDIGDTVDSVLDSYAEALFTGVAGPIANLLIAFGILAIIYLAVNNIFQFKAVEYASYIHWGVRYILIYSFATIWSHFELFYDFVQSIPEDYGRILITASVKSFFTKEGFGDIEIPDNMTIFYTIDWVTARIILVATLFLNDFSIFNLGQSILNILLGLATLVIALLFFVASLIILVFAKVGFAIGVSMAPIALTLLMLEQTRQYFQSWVQFTIGFAILPLITGTLLSLVFFVSAKTFMLVEDGGNGWMFLPFLFIMVAAVHFLFEVPQMASTLAGVSVAGVGGRAVMSAYRMAKSATAGNVRSAWHGLRHAKHGADRAISAGRRVRDGYGVAREARDAGSSRSGAIWAGIQGMRQSAMHRQSRRDQRLQDRIDGAAASGGGNSSRIAYANNSSKKGDASSTAQGNAAGNASGSEASENATATNSPNAPSRADERPSSRMSNASASGTSGASTSANTSSQGARAPQTAGSTRPATSTSSRSGQSGESGVISGGSNATSDTMTAARNATSAARESSASAHEAASSARDATSSKGNEPSAMERAIASYRQRAKPGSGGNGS